MKTFYLFKIFSSVASTPNTGIKLTTNPEVKSLMFYLLSQPGAPKTFYL